MIATVKNSNARSMLLRSSTAAELMRPYPLSLSRADSLRKVAALLSFHELDEVPVTDHAGRVVGLVSADACAAWEEYTRRTSPRAISAADLDEMDISDIVNPVVATVRDDAPARDVLEKLGKVRRVYVVNSDDELVGVISPTDLREQWRYGGATGRFDRAFAMHC